jgi:hypothetical protein
MAANQGDGKRWKRHVAVPKGRATADGHFAVVAFCESNKNETKKKPESPSRMVTKKQLLLGKAVNSVRGQQRRQKQVECWP